MSELTPTMTQQAILEATNDRPRIGLAGFFFLLFAVSWAGMVPMVLASRGVHLAGPVKLLQVFMLFGPGLVAVFVSWRNGGRKAAGALLRGSIRWRCHPAVYVAVLAGPTTVFVLGLALANVTGFTAVPFPPATKILATFATTFGVYLLLNTEELAWRGYALPRLQNLMGPRRATLVIAVLWTSFHLPLFAMRGGHPAGYPLWLFAVMIIGITAPFTAVFNFTGGSILMAHLLHQSFNAAAEALPIYPVAAHSIAPVAFSSGLILLLSTALFVGTRLGEPLRRAPTLRPLPVAGGR